jgi:gliding motility-associated-like protein
MKIKIVLTVLTSILCGAQLSAQVWLHPNRGQWTKEILYRVEMTDGSLFIDSSGFTYILNDIPDSHHEEQVETETSNKAQIIFSHFKNSTWKGATREENLSDHYRNYYIGTDQSKWRSKVHSVGKVMLDQYYQGIDFEIKGANENIKYAFHVHPGADPSLIESTIEGSDKVELIDGELHITTLFGDIVERKPVAWTIKDGQKKKVEVHFVLENNVLKYVFPNGYDETAELVIDPDIVFSTFSGSTMDNWGMTATGDAQGNLYAAGIVFANPNGPTGNYPTVAGSFDVTFNGGTQYSLGGAIGGFDVAITKFNPSGTALLYSTYFGGSANESAHSLVTDNLGNLYIMGVTSSINFPMSAGCYDNSFNGGFDILTNELQFNATDLYVARFSADGTALVGSTYVGGTDNDGINTGALFYNYGDPFRGEIIVKNNFVYVASSTLSADFPTVLASQTTLNGSQDAVVFKMNSFLTNMTWSTYLGGSGLDSGNGVQTSSTGDVYVAGGSTSPTMPFTSGSILANSGGLADGYVARLNGNTSAVMSGTFMGTSEYDQTYFVQLDLLDQVYVYGQTEGTMPISAGCYGNANSGQFVAKYTQNLQTRTWNTVIGAGTGHVEISPTAFLVSNCNDIYLAGWGGAINSMPGFPAQFSTSSGFPVTPDAFQGTTTGSNFWIGVLDADAAFLKYATFMGGTGSSSSSNHVDGGTSRFDKNGNIYHAVCGACGGSDFGFTTTPGVWSPTNQSTNCNLAAFKFELSSIEAVIATPDPLVCLPDPVVFNNNSANGNDFHWYFGDGTESTLVNPTHLYSGPGQYEVTLVVTDTNECFAPDSVTFIINIGDFQGGVVNPEVHICSGQTAQLEAFGGATYVWSPAQFLNNPNIFNPVATVATSTLFSCIVSDSCGVDTVQVQVIVSGGNVAASNDTTICLGNDVPLFVTGITSATWSPPTYLDNPNSFTPVSTPTSSIQYTVSGTTSDGCPLSETVNITVFFTPPLPVMPDTLKYCMNGSGTVTVSGGDSYLWSPNSQISAVAGPTVTISSTTERYYYCDFTNACGTVTDSMYIDLIIPSMQVGNDTIVCPGEPVTFFAEGMSSYVWNPQVSPLVSNYSSVSASSMIPRTYTILGTDQYGCTVIDSVHLDLFPQPFIQTNPDVYAVFGDNVALSATSTTTGPYVWSPAEFLSCVVCTNPIANPDQNYTYTVSYTDENGCTASDNVNIFYDPIIYVPNAFTPDGNSINSDFFAVSANIRDFQMDIFNRWGELIYTGDAASKSWNGKYKDLPCPDGVYVWKIRYRGFSSEKYFELVGHVNLIR